MVEAAPPGGGELAERAPACRRRRARAAPASSRPRSASAATAPARLGLGEESVRVEALAAQRDEQVARRDAAGVAVDARERRRRAADERARRAAGARASSSVIIALAVAALVTSRRCEPPRAPSPPARVGEREPRAADVLVVLVALAGDEDDVAAAALPTAWRIASARFSITSTSSWPIAPARICARIRSGDSRRGLSLVTTTRPASRQAIAPISGRLAASRLPPQPNTHQSLPPRALRERCERGERLLERIGRVRVVDDDLGQRAAPPRRSASDALHAAGHRRQRRTARRRVGERDAERAQHADDAEQVGAL